MRYRENDKSLILSRPSLTIAHSNAYRLSSKEISTEIPSNILMGLQKCISPTLTVAMKLNYAVNTSKLVITHNCGTIEKYQNF